MDPDVLVVDDSAAIRKILQRVLRQTGMAIGTIHEAGDGQEALELLKKVQPGLVLTDINMPKMDGLQFLAALTIIVWDGLVTLILLKIIGLVTGGLRIPDEELQAGDVGIHEEEAYPDDDVFSPALAGVGAGTGGSAPPSISAPDSGTLAGDAR